MKKIIILTILFITFLTSLTNAAGVFIFVPEKEINIININEDIVQISIVRSYTDEKTEMLKLDDISKNYKIKKKDNEINLVLYISDYDYSALHYIRLWASKDQYVDIGINNMLIESAQPRQSFYARAFVQYDYEKKEVVIDDFKTIDSNIIYLVSFAVLFLKLIIAKLFNIKNYDKIITIIGITTSGMLLFHTLWSIWNITLTLIAWGILCIMIFLIEFYFYKKRIPDIKKLKIFQYSIFSNIISFIIILLEYAIFII